MDAVAIAIAAPDDGRYRSRDASGRAARGARLIVVIGPEATLPESVFRKHRKIGVCGNAQPVQGVAIQLRRSPSQGCTWCAREQSAHGRIGCRSATSANRLPQNRSMRE
jgi:hypothetical protein